MPNLLAQPRTRSVIAASLAVAAVILISGVAVAATRAVAIADFAFSPRTITITAGDRIRWTNSDAVAHTATATNGAFDTGDLEQGESATVRFTQPGTYRYICTPHPSMTGTIRVRSAGPGPTDPPTDSVAPASPLEAGGGPTYALLVSSAALLVGLAIARRRRLGT